MLPTIPQSGIACGASSVRKLGNLLVTRMTMTLGFVPSAKKKFSIAQMMTVLSTQLHETDALPSIHILLSATECS
jgi:hypothetical protein